MPYSQTISQSWQIRKAAVTSDQGLVASQHYLASDIGADVLRRGGNAIDAAIATGLALGTVEPWMTGIGGGGYMTIYLAKSSPTLLAPAMEEEMLGSAGVQANIDRLCAAGVAWVEPETGYLASGASGKGRMAAPEVIVDAVVDTLAAAGEPQAGVDLRGRHIVVTAGPTVEDLDPVRFLTNRSSGKMGYAIARRARARAADAAEIGFPPVRSMGAPPTHMWTYMVGPQWAKWFLLTGESVNGKEAQEIGLVWKSVPREELDDTVEKLASQMAKIPWELLAANKSIVNKAMDLMGRHTLQQMAAEVDAVAHRAPIATEFNRISREQGIKAALDWRDRPFRDYRAADKD